MGIDINQITGQWAVALEPEYRKPYFLDLLEKINDEYRNETVYPAADEVFSAYLQTPLEAVKIVILGQDPYHEPDQAHGLSFSVKDGVKHPKSLVNIFKELSSDIGCDIPVSGNLSGWAQQGVLLLNTVLTVRAHEANSHKGYGWEMFTDATIQAVAMQDRPIVFILWGAQAREKKKMITNPKHLVIESAHPSPLSSYRGFFGSKPFSRCNDYLEKNGVAPIKWSDNI